MRLRILVCIMAAVFMFGGCATIGGMRPVQRMATDMMVPSLEDMVKTTLKSEDLINAQSLMETVLPLLDGLIEFSPDNASLLTIAAEGYALYSFGFVEDVDRQRAIKLYAKGKEYGMRALKQNSYFESALEDGEDFSEAVQCLTEDDVAAAFYTGFGWAFWAMRSIQEGDVKAAFDLPKITALMDRVIELDDTFFEGGPRLFYGAYFGALGPSFGGGPKKAKTSFDKALEISPNFLTTHYFNALYYAIPTMDEALFDKELTFVLDTPNNVLPEMALANAVAKVKARRLLNQKWKYFVD